MTRTSPLRAAWNTFLVLPLVLALFDANELRWNLVIYRAISAAMLLKAVVCLSIVGVTAFLLWRVKALRWSWPALFFGKDDDGNDRIENINTSPLRGPKLLGFGFLFLVITQLPSLAGWEERTFRMGLASLEGAVGSSFVFGLAHCVFAGVPLAVGLALSVGGFWFSYEYLTGGYVNATIAHTAYNSIVLAIACLALAMAPPRRR